MSAPFAKFQKINALVSRGATAGERNAARCAALRLVAKYGASECAPLHPVVGIRTAERLVAVCESVFNERSRDNWNDFWLLIPTELAADALAIVESRQRAGWKAGRWNGGADLKFLNVSEWGFEQAAKRAA